METENINYIKEAFLHPWNLVFLIAAMVGTFFAIGTPMGGLIPFFALAFQLLYLGVISRNKRFQRAVKSRKIQEHSKPPSQKEILRQLRKINQKRYVRLRKLEESIKANYQKMGYASQGMLDNHIKKLDGLLDSYLQLLYSQERYQNFSQSNKESEIVGTMDQLRREMANDPPKVKSIKQRRLGIQEARLNKFRKSRENLEVIDAQLRTIEDVANYIFEQSMAMQNPDEIGFQLDTLLTEVEETQAAVEEIEDVFRPTSVDILDDIDMFETDPLSETAGRQGSRQRS